MTDDTRAEPLSFDSVVQRYTNPLRRFFNRRLRDVSTAENLVQETFLRMVRYADSYVPGGAVSRWVYAIATNLWRDLVAREARLPLAGVADLDAFESPDRRRANPESAAMDSEVEQALLTVLAELPPKHRAVFLLKHHYSLTYAQIGDVMKISEGTAKSRMHKATRLVAEKMGRRGYLGRGREERHDA